MKVISALISSTKCYKSHSRTKFFRVLGVIATPDPGVIATPDPGVIDTPNPGIKTTPCNPDYNFSCM